MAAAWSEVAASPAFKALPPDQQEAARGQYFSDVVAPQVPPEKLSEVRAQFDSSTKTSAFSGKTSAFPQSLPRAETPFAPAVDVAKAFGSGLAGTVAGGYSGIAGSLLPGPQGQGRDWSAKVQDALTIAPKTAEGAQLTGAIAYPFEKLAQGADYIGGKVADVTGSPALGAGANAAIQAAGPGAILKGAAAVRAPAQAASQVLMRSALKPTLKAVQTGRADGAVNTMLNEGINATNGGLRKLDVSIGELNDQVTNALQSSSATVDKGAVASRIQDVINRVERSNPTPQDALRDVQKVYDDFLSNHLVPQNIPVQRAQELKRGIYQVLKDKYGQLGSDTVEAQKALGRGLKEEISGAVPGVSSLNAQEGGLINARNILARRMAVEGNKNPLGLSWLAGSPESALGFMADRSALGKSLLARGLYNIPTMAPLSQNAGMLAALAAGQQPEPRADGGPVTAGQTYLVNERRPEMYVDAQGRPSLMGVNPGYFTPPSNGTILPSVQPGLLQLLMQTLAPIPQPAPKREGGSMGVRG